MTSYLSKNYSYLTNSKSLWFLSHINHMQTLCLMHNKVAKTISLSSWIIHYKTPSSKIPANIFGLSCTCNSISVKELATILIWLFTFLNQIHILDDLIYLLLTINLLSFIFKKVYALFIHLLFEHSYMFYWTQKNSGVVPK